MNVFGKLSLTLGIQSLVALAALAPPVIAPAALPDLALATEAWLGVYIALLYLAGMASTLVSGDLIARFGPVRVSQLSLVLCGVGVGLIALGHPPLLLLAPFIIGFGYGPVTPAGSQILVKGGAPKAIGLVFSIKQTGVPLGVLIAGLALPWLIALGGWRFAIGCIVTVCLLLSVALQWWRDPFDGDRDPARRMTVRRTGASLKTLFDNPAAYRLACVSFFFGAMQLCVITFLVSYLSHGFEMTLVVAGLLMSVAQASGMVGRIGWGWLSDRSISARAVLIGLAIAMAIAAAILGSLPYGTPWFVIAVIVAVLGATAIGWNGVFLAEIARVAPDSEVGTLTGAALFFTYFGVVVGPPIFGVILSLTHSYAASFIVISAGVLIGSVLLLGRRPKVDSTVSR